MVVSWLNEHLQPGYVMPKRTDFLAAESSKKHLYISGPSGTGKSTLIALLETRVNIYKFTGTWNEVYVPGAYGMALFEEFNGGVTVNFLLKWLGGDACQINPKGLGTITKKVPDLRILALAHNAIQETLPTVFLSNKRLCEVYSEFYAKTSNRHVIKALENRIIEVELDYDWQQDRGIRLLWNIMFWRWPEHDQAIVQFNVREQNASWWLLICSRRFARSRGSWSPGSLLLRRIRHSRRMPLLGLLTRFRSTTRRATGRLRCRTSRAPSRRSAPVAEQRRCLMSNRRNISKNKMTDKCVYTSSKPRFETRV